MPAICDSITLKLSENLGQSFKKTEKENFDNNLTPTAKQVLSAKIEYEKVSNYNSLILNSLQTKYIVLKPNQPVLSSPNGKRSYYLVIASLLINFVKGFRNAFYCYCEFRPIFRVWHRNVHKMLSSE